MARVRSAADSIAGALPLLHVWRVILLCATITHELDHPALALLLLVPLNHFLYNLTSTLDPEKASPHRRARSPGCSSWLRSPWSGGTGPSGP